MLILHLTRIKWNGCCFWLLRVNKTKVGTGPVTFYKLSEHIKISGTCGLDINYRQSTLIYWSNPKDFFFFLLSSGCSIEIGYFLWLILTRKLLRLCLGSVYNSVLSITLALSDKIPPCYTAYSNLKTQCLKKKNHGDHTLCSLGLILTFDYGSSVSGSSSVSPVATPFRVWWVSFALLWYNQNTDPAPVWSVPPVPVKGRCFKHLGYEEFYTHFPFFFRVGYPPVPAELNPSFSSPRNTPE